MNGQKILEYKCLKCGHVWIPKRIHPLYCPFCKNPKWHDKKEGKK